MSLRPHPTIDARNAGRRMRVIARTLLALLFVSMGVAACSGDDDGPTPGWQGESDWADEGYEGEQPETTNSDDASCEVGETQVCHRTIGRHNDVLTCYEGIQNCVDGQWSECGGGAVTNYPSVGPELSPEKTTGTASSDKWKSYSTAKDCKNNPCDPTCKDFDENPPDGGWFVDGDEFIYTWKQGNKGNVPDEYAKKAFTEPCEIGNDCQLNHYCYDPSSGSCNHDVCTTGSGLKSGCSRCTTEVCKAKPQCCEKTYGGSCAHEPCVTGSSLKPSCDPAVKKTCDWDKTCCPYTEQKTICNWVKTAYSCKKTYNCVKQFPILKTYQCGWTAYNCKKCGYKYQCWYVKQYKAYYTCWYVPKQKKYQSCSIKKVCSLKKKCYYEQKQICSYKMECKKKKVCVKEWKWVCKTTKPKWKCVKQCAGWGKWKWCWKTCGWTTSTSCKKKKVEVCSYVNSCYLKKSCYWQSVKKCGLKVVCTDKKICEWKYKWVNVKKCGYKYKWVNVKKCGYKYGCWTAKCQKKKYCKKWTTYSKYGPYCSYWSTCYKNTYKCSQKTFSYPGSWKSHCVNKYKKINPSGCPASWPGKWDQTCIDAVHDTCGAFCKEPPPPTGEGQCIMWGPGATDPKCAGISLAVGLTCDATVPICNHGTKEAPAGIKIVHYPKGSGGFGKDNPGNIAGAKYCQTNEKIPAGECIEVTTCPGLTEGREIMVNPPGNGQINECFTGDNWGLYLKGACGPPVCASDNIKAKLKPVNIFITIDKSGSMWSRWAKTKKAFNAFFADKKSAGLNVALEFWPHSSCGLQSSWCSKVDYCAQPYIPFGKLLPAGAPTDKQEQKLINAFNSTNPGGMTPAYVALQGATKWGTSYSKTHKNEQQVVVFVTDGYPNWCGSNHAAFAKVAGDAYKSFGVKTYAVGIVGASTSLLNKIASAGGTSSGIFIDNNNQIEQKLIAAMNKIKGDSVSCDFLLPANGQYDAEDATVIYTPSGGGSAITMARVANQNKCGLGWYFDDPNNITKIHLCPATCSMVQNDAGAEIDISFGCPGGYEITEHSQTYEASCPPGTSVQWGYLSWDVEAPSSSHADFRARSAKTSSDLKNASWHDLGSARSLPTDTQQCKMTGPKPCPIDMTNKLLSDAYGRQHLELHTKLYPNKKKNKAPLIKNWHITYSCPGSE